MPNKWAKGKFTPKNPQKYIGNKAPTYRSSWEFVFMKFCDENMHITEWMSEPMRIPYFNPVKQTKTTYVPDFLVAYKDKTGQRKVQLIEIKPKKQILGEARSQRDKIQAVINQAKWQAAKQFCDQKNIEFKVITEDDIFHQGQKRK
jgi:hypothetical protein